MKKIIPLLIAAHFSLISACSSAPADYDECILKKLTASMDKSVASAIVESCRSKFPEKEKPKKELLELPSEARQKINGKFGISDYGGSGNIYNGNEDWHIEEIIILVGEPGWLDKAIAHDNNKLLEKPRTERYKIQLSVPPLSSKDFTVKVNWPSNEKYDWFIADSRGLLELAQ